MKNQETKSGYQKASDSDRLKDLFQALSKRVSALQEELEKKVGIHTIAIKHIEDKFKNLEASSITTALMENDGIEMNTFLKLKSIQEDTAIKLWKHPIQSEKKIGLHFNGMASIGVMNLEAKRDNLRGLKACGMNGHKNSIGLLINTSNVNKGKISLFEEGKDLFTRENIQFKANDKIWMKINVIGEVKKVNFQYQAESGIPQQLFSVSLNGNYKHVFPFVALFTKGSTVEIIY